MSPLVLLAGLAAETAEDAPSGEGIAIAIAIGLLLLAAGLFFLEVLLPSFGVISVMGMVSAAGAVLIAFGVGSTIGFTFLGGTIVLVPIVVVLAMKVLRRTPLVLAPEADAGRAAEGSPELPVGTRGVALTSLRPSGTVLFGGKKVSVVTAGDLVDKDTTVEVVRVEGTRTVDRTVWDISARGG